MRSGCAVCAASWTSWDVSWWSEEGDASVPSLVRVGREQISGFEAGCDAPLGITGRGERKLRLPSRLPARDGLADEANQGVLVGQEVTLQDGHMASGQAMHRHAFEPQVFQEAVAAFGRVAAAVAFLPGWAAIGDFAGQSHTAIAVGASDGGGVAVFVCSRPVGTLRQSCGGFMLATLGTPPLRSSSLSVIAVGV